MPGPGRRGGHGRGGRGPAFRAGPAFRPTPAPRPFVPVVRGPGPLGGLVAGVAAGAVIAAVTPRPRHRYPPPRAGYIYVVHSGAAPRAVRMEEAAFIVTRVNIPSYDQGDHGEVQFMLEVSCIAGEWAVVISGYKALAL